MNASKGERDFIKSILPGFLAESDDLPVVAKLREHIRLAEFAIKVAESEASPNTKYAIIFSDDVHGELPGTGYKYDSAGKEQAIIDYARYLAESLEQWRLIIKAVDEGET